MIFLSNEYRTNVKCLLSISLVNRKHEAIMRYTPRFMACKNFVIRINAEVLRNHH